jgi:hypothetical protein
MLAASSTKKLAVGFYRQRANILYEWRNAINPEYDMVQGENVLVHCSANSGVLASYVFKHTPSFIEWHHCEGNPACPPKSKPINVVGIESYILQKKNCLENVIEDYYFNIGSRNCLCSAKMYRTLSDIGNK